MHEQDFRFDALKRKEPGMGSLTRSENPFVALKAWFKRQSGKKQTWQALVITALVLTVVSIALGDLWIVVLYLTASFLRVGGMAVLIYKLTKRKTCAGLSLKSQELTAICIAARIYLNFGMGIGSKQFSLYSIGNLAMDLSALVTTTWIIYIIRFKLRSTYMAEADNLPLYYVLVPCAFLALATQPLANPSAAYTSFHKKVIVTFVPYLEAVLVLPQLRVMQSKRVVEALTAFYVFALGAERLFKFAFWVSLALGDYMEGSFTGDFDFGYFLFMVSEVVQSFILADFVYYYVKTLSSGRKLMRLPTIVVDQSPV